MGNSDAKGVSSDGSVVVGTSYSSLGLEGFRWTSDDGMTGLGDLAGGGFNSEPRGISSDGSTVVGEGLSASGPEAFRWTSAEGMVGLGDLSGGIFSSVAFGASSDGSVIVGFSRTASGNEAFIWDQANNMRNLREVLTNDYSLNLTGWNLTRAYGISDDGQTIVGIGNNPSGFGEAWVATIPEIPEPATLSLLALGVLVLRRKRT